MKREKVVITQIVAMVMATVTLLVALDVLSLSSEQLAQTEEALAAVLTVLIPLALSFWSRGKVTPLSSPRDNEGQFLLRADGSDAVE